MWHLLTHILTVSFAVLAVVKFIAIWVPDVGVMMWRGEMPKILDFSPVKFFAFAVIFAQLHRITWVSLLLVAAAYFYYPWWLLISIRYLKKHYSWPRTTWMIISHYGGPCIGWS